MTKSHADRYHVPFGVFVGTFSSTVLLLTVLMVVREGDPQESWDRLFYAGCLVLAATIVLLSLAGDRVAFRLRAAVTGWPQRLAAAIAILGFGVGVAAYEHHSSMPLQTSLTHWVGFGPLVFVGALLMSGPIWRLLIRLLESGPGRRMWVVTIAVICTLYIPSLVQTSSSVLDMFHTQYVVSDALSIAAGSVPYVDFIPQYQSLTPLLFAPFRGILSADELANLVIVTFSLFGVTAVALGVYLAARAIAPRLDGRVVFVALLLVVPLACVTTLPRFTLQGSIAAFLSALPGRVFFGMILALLTIELVMRSPSGKTYRRRVLATGWIAGLVAWNSQDFGLAAAVVASAMVATRPTLELRERVEQSAIWFAGVSSGLLAYLVGITLAGKKVDAATIGYFQRAAADGGFSEPIQVPGPVYVVIPLVLSLSALAWRMWLSHRESAAVEPQLDRTVATAAYFASWCGLGLPYYINFSFASGQLQILLLPLSVALASFTGLVLAQRNRDQALEVSLSWPRLRPGLRRGLTAATLSSLVVALPLACIVQVPDPRELYRLVGSVERHVWPGPDLMELERAVPLALSVAESSGGGIAYFGEAPNYIRLKYGIEPALRIDNPFEMTALPSVAREGCSWLDSLGVRFLLVGSWGRANFEHDPNGRLCGRYAFVEVPGLPPTTLAIRE